MRVLDQFYSEAALRREQVLQRLAGSPLTVLLPEQERLLEVYREEYFRVGSSTEPADRERAERAITELYVGHGYAVPRLEWGPSPRWGIERVNSGWPFLGYSLWDSLGSSRWRALQNSLGTSLLEALQDSLKDSLGVQLRASLLGPLGSSLRGSLRSSLAASLGSLLRGALGASLGGNQESYWVAYHLYGHDVLAVPYSESAVQWLHLHDELVRSCGWWWPYLELCVCTDRPELLEWTEEVPPKLRRVRYRDGWEVAP